METVEPVKLLVMPRKVRFFDDAPYLTVAQLGERPAWDGEVFVCSSQTGQTSYYSKRTFDYNIISWYNIYSPRGVGRL